MPLDLDAILRRVRGPLDLDAVIRQVKDQDDAPRPPSRVTSPGGRVYRIEEADLEGPGSLGSTVTRWEVRDASGQLVGWLLEDDHGPITGKTYKTPNPYKEGGFWYRSGFIAAPRSAQRHGIMHFQAPRRTLQDAITGLLWRTDVLFDVDRDLHRYDEIERSKRELYDEW